MGLLVTNKDFWLELTAFSDADHAGCLDTQKSTSGGIQFLGNKLVSWMSKKQNYPSCTGKVFKQGRYVALSQVSITKRVFKGVKYLIKEVHIGTKARYNVGKASMEIVSGKDYILLPFWTADPLFSYSSKDSPDAGFKPSGEEEKKDTKNPWNKDSEDNAVDENIVYGCADDPNMPNLEEIVYSDDDEDVGAEADMNNLDAF
ncbi:ribonuclease H-like domain-containing protein [Tanacetum coccineum]